MVLLYYSFGWTNHVELIKWQLLWMLLIQIIYWRFQIHYYNMAGIIILTIIRQKITWWLYLESALLRFCQSLNSFQGFLAKFFQSCTGVGVNIWKMLYATVILEQSFFHMSFSIFSNPMFVKNLIFYANTEY